MSQAARLNKDTHVGLVHEKVDHLDDVNITYDYSFSFSRYYRMHLQGLAIIPHVCCISRCGGALLVDIGGLLWKKTRLRQRHKAITVIPLSNPVKKELEKCILLDFKAMLFFTSPGKWDYGLQILHLGPV